MIVNTHQIIADKEVSTMKRMGKLLLTVLVILLACSLVIFAGSSIAKANGKKIIKIKVDKNTGEILDIKVGKDDGSDEDSTPVISPPPSAQYVGTLLFTHSSPGCIYVILANGKVRRICW